MAYHEDIMCMPLRDEIEEIVLELIDPQKNNKKFYWMSRSETDLSSGVWTAEWGRIGSFGQSKTYTPDNGDHGFWDQYKAKRNKGYKLISYRRFGEEDSDEAEA